MKALLTLSQWMSPAFPVGAFAFSQGLEMAIADGQIASASSLTDWLEDLVDHGAIHSDVVLLAEAFRRDDLEELDRLARAFQPSLERLDEGVQLGSAFARTVRDVWGFDVPDCLYPVAVGRAGALAEVPLSDLAGLYALSAIGNLVSAAIRLVPLGQTEGQQVIVKLSPRCEALGERAGEMTLDDLASAAFLSDIASMRHETLKHRIFQS